MRFAVVGAGAIGTLLAVRLCAAGFAVALHGRDGPLARARCIEGGTEAAASFAVDDAPADVVVLAVKAHQQVEALPSMLPLLAPGGTLVTAQNGIPFWYLADRPVRAVDPDGVLLRAFPASQVTGMVVYLGAVLRSPGVVEARPEAGLVIGDGPRAVAVGGALEAAGFPVRTTDAIRMEIWTKLLGNAVFNPMSVLTRAGLGTMASDPGTRAVAAAGMAEAMAVAAAYDAAPQLSIDERLAITARLGDHKTSMLQDFEAGRPLELAAITGAPLELAAAAGVPTPTLHALHALATLASR